MSNHEQTFVDGCLNGERWLTEIDDFVERWHQSGQTCTLAAFLGMTREEYKVWVEMPASLPFILLSRKRSLPLRKLLETSGVELLAARAGSAADARKVLDWLRKTGRLTQ